MKVSYKLREYTFIRFVISIIFLGLFQNVLLAQNTDSLQIIELQKQVAELKQSSGKIDMSSYLTLAGIVATLTGLIGYLFKKSIESKISSTSSKLEKEFDDRIVKTINEKKSTIDKTFEQVDLEQKIISTKIIYLYGEDTPVVKRVLKNIGFDMNNNIVTSEKEAQKGYNLLFINNENGTLDMDAVLDMVNKLPNEVFTFYYNTNRIFFPTIKLDKGKEDKVNFVTNASQIYGNLLNTLRYQDKL